MDPHRIRNLLPTLYAIAIFGALLSGNGTALLAVIIIGAIVVGAGYTALSGGPNRGRARPDRATRRAGRRGRT
ncbi:MAG: hypothetical protein ACR2K2_04540 [Mycobacteriales bacterium]